MEKNCQKYQEMKITLTIDGFGICLTDDPTENKRRFLTILRDDLQNADILLNYVRDEEVSVAFKSKE